MKRLPKLKLETKLLRSRNLLQKHLQTIFFSICNSSFNDNTLSNSDLICTDFLNISYISESYVKRAIIRLGSTKGVGTDELLIL
jgi:hypothetical protein